MSAELQLILSEISSLNGRLAALESSVAAQGAELFGEDSALIAGSTNISPTASFSLVPMNSSSQGASVPHVNYWRVVQGKVFFGSDPLTQTPALATGGITPSVGYFGVTCTAKMYIWVYVDIALGQWCLVVRVSATANPAWEDDANWGDSNFPQIPLYTIGWDTNVQVDQIEAHHDAGDIFVGGGADEITVLTDIKYNPTDHEIQVKTKDVAVISKGAESAWTKMENGTITPHSAEHP